MLTHTYAATELFGLFVTTCEAFNSGNLNTYLG